MSEDSPQGEWDRIAEQMMLTCAESGHPVFRFSSPLSRGVLKSKCGRNCQYTSALMVERLKLFFAQLFLYISSVCTEQSQKCVKNVTLAMIEQWDLLWKDNLTHCSCQVWWRHTYFWPIILHKKKIYCKDTLKYSHNSQIQWLVVSTLCQEMKVYLNQKVGSEGTPRLDPYLKLQLVAYKVNMEWISESSPWIRTILTRGSEFLMAWISCSQTWTTRTKTTTSRKPQKCSSKTMR